MEHSRREKTWEMMYGARWTKSGVGNRENGVYGNMEHISGGLAGKSVYE